MWTNKQLDEIYAYQRLRSKDEKYMKSMDDLIDYELFGEAYPANYKKIKEAFAPETNIVLVGVGVILYAIFLFVFSKFMQQMPDTAVVDIISGIVYFIGLCIIVHLLMSGVKFWMESKRYQILYRILQRYSREQIVDAYNKAHPDNKIE